MSTTQKIQLAIKATPERVWDALTNGKVTPAYYYGFEADYDLEPGRPYRYTAGDAEVITGTVLAVDPGRSLTASFRGVWDPAVAELPESTVTFTVDESSAMPMPGITFLTLRHEGLPDSPAVTGLENGWVAILSGLKTLLETDAPMIDAPH